MIDFFLDSYKQTPTYQIILEAVAFIFGIMSVWYAKKEDIRVYPVGLIATLITMYLLYVVGYFGDMAINLYYSILSIYGWYKWSKPTADNQPLEISRTTANEKRVGVALFILTIAVVYGVYKLFGYPIEPENYIDMLTSGIFFTAMWYMALKKIENWTLWIIADVISIPLYAYRGLGMLSLQFAIFTILAIMAYLQWRKNLQIKSD